MSGSNDFAWQGAQDPADTAHVFNSRDFHIQQSLASARTALPVEVVRAPYDASGNAIPPGTVGPIGFVDVRPLINQVDGYGNATPHGTIYRRPYFRYQSALGAVIADPQVGDIGVYVVQDRDSSIVQATGAQGNPGSRRKHDLADGVYHGQQIAGTPVQGIAFTSTGLTIFDRNGNTIAMGPSGITLADKNGNVIATSAAGTTTTVKSGNAVVQTAGGTPSPVETVAGTSPVAKADG